MLTTLKDIFRPTISKIALAVVGGAVLTLVGMVLSGVARHGPILLEYIAGILILPGGLVGWLGLDGYLALGVFAFLQAGYMYLLSCAATYLLGRVVGRRFTKR